MKNSTMTLQEAVDLLPRTLRQRYSGQAFPWKAGNLILADFEKELEDHFFIGEVALLLLSGITDYALDPTIRHLRGIYQILPTLSPIPYRPQPIKFIQQEDRIRFDNTPILSDDDDITGTVPVGGPGSLDTVFDNTAGKLDDTDLTDGALAGRLLRVTHASTAVEWKLLRGNTVADTTADINGALSAVAAPGDTYLITANFYMMEVVKYLTRLTSLDDVLPIPADWEACFLAHLRYRYEAQSEEGSNNTAFWFREYRRELTTVKADGRHRSDTPVKRPRSLPPFFT
jgi:hypothetical protein